ncbi:MAG: AMP-dependent synthetase [Deltaproteobacteria bacterium HGW-Deltaproteobacteria-15]|jgi:acyl-CoA synthetase (AMP-forming)/AMP-acid ligase II|nr:MAG: AMP-dependent synthetase [Deltaproteobacteria bacterium HGW-Deltaproteobacteria-15]
MNLIDVVAKFARISPRATAFVEVRPLSGLRQEITWEEFRNRTNRIANRLLQQDIHKHDKVFLLGRNSIRWLETYFAILKTGGWAVPLNFRFTDEDLLYCGRVAEPSAFVFDKEYGQRINGLRKELNTVSHYCVIGPDRDDEFVTLEDLVRNGSPEPVPVAISDEDECALYFTSGTTGMPKPVLLRQKSLMCVAATEASNHHFNSSDRFLMMPPMYHLAIGHLLAVMLAGGCSVLLTEQISPRHIIETVARERITAVFLLVPWAVDLLNALDRKEIRIEEHDLSCWRRTFMGAQAIPPVLVHRIKGYFPHMEYDTTYGLSESSGPGVIHLGSENERKVGAIGKPNLFWDARIVGEDGEEVIRGEVGEIIVRGDGVMKEYYKNPELTKTAIRNGWLHTGDLGRMDEEGFITLVDRKKDLIISGGENIYPVELEAAILKHPKVHDVAVIGAPDDRLGEITVAVIQPKKGESLTEEEIVPFFEQQLPRYKRPRRVIFGEVPRSPTGKIEKPKLRAKYAGKK